MVVASAMLAGAGTAFGASSDVAFSQTRDGSVSWGMDVQQRETSDITVDLYGDRPVETSRLTFGAVFFDEDENWQIMAAFTFLLSPDRQIVRPAPETGANVEPMVVQGDESKLENVEFSIQTDASDEASAQTHCPAWFCASLTIRDAEPREHNLITWMGGLSTVEMQVSGDGVEDVTVNRGDAHAVGDAELPAGAANVQAQETVCDARTSAPSCPGADLAASYDAKFGAKAIADVTVPVEIDQKLWGFWKLTDVKIVCSFTVGVCPDRVADRGISACQSVLSFATDAKCGRGDIKWNGPGDLGGDSAYGYHSIPDAPSGDYAFTVERLVDTWGPRIYEPETTSFIFAGEFFTDLNIADVELPNDEPVAT
jgi:hypothetical protein